MALLALQRFAEETSLTAPNQPLRPDQLHPDFLKQYYAWLSRPHATRGGSVTATGTDSEAERRPKGRRASEADQAKAPAKKSYSPATIGLYLIVAQANTEWLAADGQIDYALFNRMKGQAERQRRRVLLRNHVLLYTLYFTAGRVSEVLSLRCAQVDGRETAQIRGKGGKTRALFLCQDLRRELERLLAQRRQDSGYRASAPLFVSYSNRNAGEQLTPHSAWDIVRAAAEAVFAGLARAERSEAHPHLLRHLRAQHLYSAEMPLAELQAILGHASVDTTRRFYAPLDEQTKIQGDLEEHGLSPAEIAARAAAAKVTRGE